MAREFAKCSDCGTLFLQEGTQPCCSECMLLRMKQLEQIDAAASRMGAADLTVERLAAETDMRPEAVERLVKSLPGLQRMLKTARTCTRCKERPALSGADQCLPCRLALQQELGKAAEDLSEKIETMKESLPGWEERSAKSSGVTTMLTRKRRRFGRDRFDPTPKGRY